MQIGRLTSKLISLQLKLDQEVFQTNQPQLRPQLNLNSTSVKKPPDISCFEAAKLDHLSYGNQETAKINYVYHPISMCQNSKNVVCCYEVGQSHQVVNWKLEHLQLWTRSVLNLGWSFWSNDLAWGDDRCMEMSRPIFLSQVGYIQQCFFHKAYQIFILQAIWKASQATVLRLQPTRTSITVVVKLVTNHV